MQEDVKRLYVTLLIAMVALFLFNKLFPKQELPTEEATAPVVAEQETQVLKHDTMKIEDLSLPTLNVDDVIKKDARIEIQNDSLRGSIRVKGARLDNLYLKKYKQSLEDDSADVELFSPTKTENPYYAEMGWISTSDNIKVPNSDTMWTVKQAKLTPDSPIVLEWNNGQGLRFIRRISIDNNYMFRIQQDVENNTMNNYVTHCQGGRNFPLSL